MNDWVWNGQTGQPTRPFCQEHGRFLKADGTCPTCEARPSDEARQAMLAEEYAERCEMLGL